MATFQQFLDDRIAPWRRGELVREHGFSIALLAVGLAYLRFELADWSGPDFTDRLIGIATLADLDVSARGGVFAQCTLLFVLGILGGAWLLPRVARSLGADAWRCVEGLAAAGLILVGLATWRVIVDATVLFVAAALVVVFVSTWLDRLTRRTEVVGRGTYVAWLVGTGFAFVVPIYDFAPGFLPRESYALPLATLGVAIVLDLVRRVMTLGADVEARARRFDRWLYAVAPFAVLAAAPVLRNELYCLANQWGYLTVRPAQVEAGVVLLLAAWGVWRFVAGVPACRRTQEGRLDVERVIGRLTFPWIVGGIVAVRGYLFDHGPSPDFFEPANAGLMIQQLWDFGRVPFLETFSAHGLADSFFGFVYSALVGFRDESWAMFDYLYTVMGALVAFQVLRAWLSSSTAALFVTLALPAGHALMPPYCVLAAVAVFVLAWVFQRRSTWSWFVFTLWCALVFLWRLDMGFAHAIGALFTFATIGILLPEHRPPWSAMVRGAAIAAGALLIAYLSLCAWRDVDPLAQLRDFKTVVGSNQAFGLERVAHRRTEIVMSHVFVVPMLVLLTCLALLVHLRGRVDRKAPIFFAVLGTLFFTGYYFANYPRGLVRHSFVEGSNVMIASFALFVLAGSSRWWMPHARRVTVFAVFCGIASALGFNLDVERPDGREVLPRAPLSERTPELLNSVLRVPYSRTPLDRSFVTPWFSPGNTTETMPFFAAELGPDETFLDLSNSPMLYFHARRVSPHWLNHLMIVVGDRLQDRVIEGLERHDVPFVTLTALASRTSPTTVPAPVEIDGVPFRVRHYRLLRWVYEHYDPLTMVGRWQVWIRRDRLLRREPTHEASKLLAELRAVGEPSASATSPTVESDDGDAPTPREEGVVDGAESGTSDDSAGDRRVPPANLHLVLDGREKDTGRRVLLSPEKSYLLRIEGRADAGAALDLTFEFQSQAGVSRFERRAMFPAGDRVAWCRIPSAIGFRTLVRCEVSARAGLELDGLALVEHSSVDGRDSDRLLHTAISDALRALPRVWGAADREAGRAPRAWRELVSDARSEGPIVPVDPVSEFPWKNGILTTKPGFLRDRARLDLPIAVGDEIEFAASGRRRVRELRGPVVFVEGAALDPVGDGAPRPIRKVDAASRTPSESPLEITAARKFEFAPLVSDGVPPNDVVGDDELVRRRAYAQLSLRVRRLEDAAGALLVDYGQGSSSLGRFVLELGADGDAHDYVVRLGMQYNWCHRDIDWVSLAPNGGRVKIERLALEEGD